MTLNVSSMRSGNGLTGRSGAVMLCCLLFVGLIAKSEFAVAHESSGAGESLPGLAMHVPLWKVLPTKHFATLGEGVVNGRRWAVFTFARDDPGAGQRPCIESVTLRYQHGLIAITTGAPSCGSLAPPRSVPVMTEYAFTNVGGLAIGMTVDPSVARIEFDFSTGPDVGVATKLLNPGQAKKAHVRQFRYVAVGLSRKACLEAFAGIGANGSTLFQASPRECAS